MSNDAYEHLIRYFLRRDDLSSEEIELIRALPKRLRSFSRGEDLISEHERSTESCLITSGLAAREMHFANGTRQIAALHIPGDFVDLHALTLKVMDHSVTALSPCQAAFIPHSALLPLTEKSPHLTRLFWLSTVIDGAIQRVWIANLGRRSSMARLAHLICELYLRLNAVDLASDNCFDFHITQAELADILGLSVVHVNRTLQDLRATGLIIWKGTRVTIIDYARLTELADFDPTFLNLFKEPR